MASNAKNYKKGDLKPSDIANDPVLKKNQEDKLFGRNNSQGKGSWSRIDPSDKKYRENFQNIFGKHIPHWQRDEDSPVRNYNQLDTYLDMYLSGQIEEGEWYRLCQGNRVLDDHYKQYLKNRSDNTDGTN